MQSRSVSRELALLMLGQISDRLPPADLPLDHLLRQALASLNQHVRETLDSSELELQNAQQQLLDSELIDGEAQIPRVREHLRNGLAHAEQALNRLSASLELPRLLMLADQEEIRRGALDRARAVLERRDDLDQRLDGVMEGWRLTRLPRIDRDILRLAAVDLYSFGTPAAVACNEAVELANRYSDDQGRRMINGVLRRLITTAA
ncbi:transcription antitermination factor NusB [Synechococcus sp. CS-602]|uniref:transcription antitermination factor NusB n=1 Tax=Synechococcaceae TaxID=1890426 RepID=UPI0008FF6C49|nr:MULTISPECIES: transcription antitermination factor NusB [Synechococcaceae]MCT4364857.1 transcription antitermination factor NusB [Candidatus Regnicoccus frigidus MAG-AL1]APD48136.1 transcription antitermination factor NusB [Synechococcus sp. SynAce01]MCT0203361.1 transcription antitermination factor NusB [Synechococcus sp. CS-603]MCT0204009.1 transcription antitermination factor NusB [Synechococcus sp. CS-602]MCT0246581.1 transcription antitermination factor NusB [Synechococcus sp. CS-601]